MLNRNFVRFDICSSAQPVPKALVTNGFKITPAERLRKNEDQSQYTLLTHIKTALNELYTKKKYIIFIGILDKSNILLC